MSPKSQKYQMTKNTKGTENVEFHILLVEQNKYV